MLKRKYSIHNWIISQEHVKLGDKVAFEDNFKEVHGIVVELPEDTSKILVRREDTGYKQTLNFYSTTIFLLCRNGSQVDSKCTCGAKYTSNPNYHLPYCEENKS